MPLVLTRRPDQSVHFDLTRLVETAVRISLNKAERGKSPSEILAEIPQQEVVVKVGRIAKYKVKLIVEAPDVVKIVRSEIMEEATG